jgi:hypothetical protein
MKALLTLFITVSSYAVMVRAQPVLQLTKNGQISFFSATPLENIEAVNNEVSSLINTQTGDLVFAVLIKGFHFQRALMEEHFNENYMESSKLPKAYFKGKITNLSAINFLKEGTYKVMANGELTLHGVTKKMMLPGSIIVQSGKLQVVCKFTVKPKDFNIQIPRVVVSNIAEVIEVSVNCKYEEKK